MPDSTQTFADALVEYIRPMGRCFVAYSGGVDSAVVAQATVIAIGFERSLAITAISPSVSSYELKHARDVAIQIGIQHETIATKEIANPAYIANRGDRCYHCKNELYSQVSTVISLYSQSGYVLNGTNKDDLGDHRPGLVAASEHNVKSPLADLKIDKSQVRRLAKFWNLPVWDKPASPCLASRIAYGETVTIEKLKLVEDAEALMRSLDFAEFRVRLHPEYHASVEVAASELKRLDSPELRTVIENELKQIGFRSVRFDPEGFKSGKLNRSLGLVGIGQNKSQ